MTSSLNKGAHLLHNLFFHEGNPEREAIGIILLVSTYHGSQLVKPRTDPAWLKVSILFMPEVG